MKNVYFILFLLLSNLGTSQCFETRPANGVFNKTKISQPTFLQLTDSLTDYQGSKYLLLTNEPDDDNTEIIFPTIPEGRFIAFFKNTNQPLCIIERAATRTLVTMYYLNGLPSYITDTIITDVDTIENTTIFYKEGFAHYKYFSNKDTIIEIKFKCNGDTLQYEKWSYKNSTLLTWDFVLLNDDNFIERSHLQKEKKRYALYQQKIIWLKTRKIIKKKSIEETIMGIKRKYY